MPTATGASLVFRKPWPGRSVFLIRFWDEACRSVSRHPASVRFINVLEGSLVQVAISAASTLESCTKSPEVISSVRTTVR
jgi:transketolase C-terminal domain/subunit